MKSLFIAELAQKYFPNSTPRSAYAQLKRWIKLNKDLCTKLEELHYKPRQRVLTPLQYNAIIYYLGEPE